MRRLALVAAAFLVAAGPAAFAATRSAGSTRLPGLMVGKGPWDANDGTSLRPRLKAIGLHALPREALVLHIHQRMVLVVNGKFLYVPAGIGIDAKGKFIAELRAHDLS